MSTEYRVVKDVGAAFAEEVAKAYSETTDKFTIALSGGSTATACYEALRRIDIDWGTTYVVWGDERRVPLDHPDSNYLLARNALLDYVSPPAAVHPMGGDETADNYEKIVADLSPIDFIHLGMGDDGHTASLFPDSPALEVEDRLVVETGDDLHKHPRMTLTFPAIAQARRIVFTVTGANKADMLTRVRAGDDYPAARVSGADILWLVDEAAAGN